MKRKITLIILCIIGALSLVLGLTGCSGETKKEYDYLVTFNYNTQNLNVDGDFGDQYLGVMAGSRIMQPCKPDTDQYKNSDFREKQIPRYEIRGWYVAKYDDNGEVLTNGSEVVLDRQWNFDKDVVNENITLYASLALKSTVRLIVDGEVANENSFVTGRVVTRNRFSPVNPKKSGYTFYDYYADAEFKEKFVFPFTVGTDDIDIYARFIEGENWSIVSTAKAFVDSYHTSAKIFVDADLDFTDLTWKSGLEFGGEINGNGHTLRNITCPLSGTVSGTQINFGMFGVLRSQSYIRDITFENVTVTISTITAVPVQAALFAWDIQSNAKLENVTVSGTISKGKIYDGGDATLHAVCYRGNINSETVKNCDFTAITINDD